MSLTLIGAVTIFALTYIAIISERVHRTVAALVGATLLILLGILEQEHAIEGIDFNTLGLLIGMMVVVNIAKGSGMFQYVAFWAARVTKGKPVPLFLFLGVIVALFSAFLDNVTTVLLMVPVMFVLANNLKISVKPLLIGAILLSNIGGTATLIGDPPNILVGSASGLTFNDFLIHLAPISIVVSAVTLGLLFLIYRKKLITTPEAQANILKFDPKHAITDKRLLIKSLIVLGVILAGFITHNMTGLEGATIAMGGAALLLLMTMNHPEEYLEKVEWGTIFFFIGLFIVVAGLEEVGVIHMAAESLLRLTEGNPVMMGMLIVWGSAIFSAIIDNIPFVATMIPLIQDIGAISGIALAPLWWALLVGADLGGNATLVGASANVVVSGMAEKEDQKISFVEYLKIALPLTFVGVAIGSVYLYLRYFMFM
ncbi:MAG: hypothetical protein A3E07_01640 [Candidatus Wildermuthbacteria bacterium RIFCSPHIGHO2_12_FULL_45_9]|uniref:Citrate transporter-like domain-containing protein n=1 Tax=Candidatus Wildermuthbacteria bacterium RIFCSPHIGHO2_02_FULL_45_25 TaxID=1802450 RepID=A0A1G2R0W7_9BACT|nr:MAG: hypothetical protein A2748_02960 [Candidatus Wildermuthbacteria bacterium RIFCSPHIGHO2_01_FULL_45_20]OHA66496.1 MAG: hypothetical protein A3C04_04135 [Candidatus Wildermuthbacteria bacterium RIFCSPHIGHO2_02_FULL_45_25]OHA71148.1 MAG: hypothetical protein A3E07_01640 [Candidatus Wildermuthbacteria bacterium RIFCSPHIGHO2_12_FULL_45_9]